MNKQKQTIQQKTSLPSTKRYLEIAEIRDGTLVMKDGSIRVVLLTSSINFSLKSEEEQQAIVGQYVSFLNFLDFPLEVIIQSRKLNIDKYLDDIKKFEQKQKNELLRMQTTEYIKFIRELVDIGKIMQKRFYVVIPYSSLEDKKENFFTKLVSVFSPAEVIRLKNSIFEEYQKKIEKRINKTVGSLSGMGVSAERLDTQGLVELFYNTYNMEVYNQEKLGDLEEMRVEK
jgi:hypothetical protein